MNFVLYGVKSSGKTTLAKRIAQYFNYQYIDTDRLIEQHYELLTQHTLLCSEIYKLEGADYYYDLEQQMVNSLVGVTDTIISVGGSTFLRPVNRDLLKDLATLIYLQINYNEFKNRILKLDELPAAVSSINDNYDMHRYYDKRVKIYLPCADHVFDNQQSVDISVSKLIDLIDKLI